MPTIYGRGRRIRNHWAAVARREILEKFDAGPGRSAKARDPQASAKYIVQMLLLGTVVLAFSCDAHAQRIAIELQAHVCVGNNDRGVIDAEKQFIVSLVPPRIALVQGKLENFEKVTVWVTKIKGTDACAILDVTRQLLRSC